MYSKGEVVWAKIKGFPWWPGVVAKVIVDKENPSSMMEILVNFIGENSHAQLSLDKVANFQQKYQEYAKMKKKKLLESIETANRIVRGETSYEAESIRAFEPSSKSNPSTKKRKDNGKPFEKSPSNDFETGIAHYDSDKSSMENLDITSPSPADKLSKKGKITDKKDNKKKNNATKPLSESNTEKDSTISKAKNGVSSKRDFESEINGTADPMPVKLVKKNENQETNKSESKKTEELNGKLGKSEKQNFKSGVLPTLSTQQSTAESDSFDLPSHSTILKNGYSDAITTKNVSAKANEHTFESLYNLIIEKIVNYSSNPISGSLIEKSIDSVISKINPETINLSEILEKDLGKSLHTLLILLDELCNSAPKAGGDMDIESELAGIRDKLINFIDVIKNRLILRCIENSDYRNVWLKKLEHKREEKMQRDEKNRKNEEKEKHDKPKKVDEKDRQEESKKAREKPKEALKEAPKEAIKNNKLDKVNQQLDEEGDVAIKVEEEEEKVASTLQINFEEYRFENDKKKMVTTSTKISKATHNEGKKAEPKQKEAVSNPGLRKKICLKMSKILQEKYGLSKDAAQEITLRTESKIRHINPDMQTEYKDKVLTILKLLKFSLIDIKDFANDFNIDFSSLKEKLNIYQKQHADSRSDEGLDSFCTGKDEGNVGKGKMSELK